MSWHQRILNIVRSNGHAAELDRELAFHVAELADRLEAEGMPRATAEAEARRRFGNRAGIKERAREADIVPWIDGVAADVRYAVRDLVAHPAFTAVTVLSLALGIGANTAIFGLIDSVLLRALPVQAPDELLGVTMGGPNSNIFTNPLWEAIRDANTGTAGVLAYAPTSFDRSSGGAARRVDGAWVSGAFFATLGVRPAVGRLLAPDDDRRGCAPVAVLDGGLWTREYARDPAIVGRQLSLDGHPFTIVGVADPEFFGVEVGRRTQVYAPLCAIAVTEGNENSLNARSNWWMMVLARRAPHETVEATRARLRAVSPGIFASTTPGDWPAEAQNEYRKRLLDVVPATTGVSEVRDIYRPALYTVMAVVGIVLLVACANVANLQLARGRRRRRELAIRLALGAGRGRLVRQLLTESLLLAAAGALCAVVVARWGSAVIVALLPGRMSTVWLDLSLSGRVLGFTAVVACGTAVLFGLLPAIRATRVDPQSAMKADGRGIADGHARWRLGRALVATQVALSLVLVVGAGLLIGTFRNLSSVDAGFDRRNVLLVHADFANAHVPSERSEAVRDALLARLRALPGVASASIAAITPVSGRGWNGGVSAEGFAPKTPRDGMSWFNAVSDDYFTTTGTTRVAGRDFIPADERAVANVAIVNERFARDVIGHDGSGALGRTFRTDMGPQTGSLTFTIVGVVRDAKYRSLRESGERIAYLPMRHWLAMTPQVSQLYFEVRSASARPESLVPAVQRAFAETSAGIVLDVTTFEEQVQRSLATERLLATLAGFFGALALLLATIGLYGTMTYTVARRRAEIGVRIALGAGARRVMAMVLGEVGRLLAAGLIVGLLAALSATRLMSSFLFGVTATDRTTFGVAALLLGAVALAAGAVPAWRASRVDPVEAMRE